MRACQDCQQQFQPALPKQYYCRPCRHKIVIVDTRQGALDYTNRLSVNAQPGFLADLLEGTTSFKKLAKQIGVSTTAVSEWNTKGRVPGQNGNAQKLCEAVGTTREELEQRYGRR